MTATPRAGADGAGNWGVAVSGGNLDRLPRGVSRVGSEAAAVCGQKDFVGLTLVNKRGLTL